MDQSYLRKRITWANERHLCSACLAPLPRMSAEDEARSRAEAHAQGITDEQLADPTYSAKICDPCWSKSGGLAAIMARRN